MNAMRCRALVSIVVLSFLGLSLLIALLPHGSMSSRAAAAELDDEAADLWSLRPIRRPPLPRVADPSGVRTPIDAFILARLDAAGLKPAPETDRRTFLQRVAVDLTGLRPTPEEIEAFVHDRSTDAYEKVVDRLLASPAYGERWGRHWLDVVRFGESSGYEVNNPRPNAWPYRDYVIRAFNRDTPYPEFIRDQLAGETDADPLTTAATGFLVGGAHDLVGIANIEGQLQQRQDDLTDMVATTGTTFLGMTVGCARCHDHKFDPITQHDFYGLEAVFSGVTHGERELAKPQASPEVAALRAELARLDEKADAAEPLAGPPGCAVSRRPVEIQRNVERFQPVKARHVRFTIRATLSNGEPCIDELEIYGPASPERNLALASTGAKVSASSLLPGYDIHKIEHLNDGRHGNSRSWISAEPGKGWVQISLPRELHIDRVVWGRDREQRFADRLALDYKVEVSRDGQTWQIVAGSWDRRSAPSSDAAKNRFEKRRAEIERRLAELTKPQRIYAGVFGKAEPIFVLKRGDPMRKGKPAEPSAVAVIGRPLAVDAAAPERQRRLALADWLSDPANPLPARVMVNRVWQHHFGAGLVRTPNDFGFSGDRPSHPELLDWLAAEYRANGWRLKPLHRLIVLSAAYRRGHRSDARAVAMDADNRLLWRRTPQRVDAEVLRDTMLQVSGQLNRKAGGPGYQLWSTSNYVTVYQPKPTLDSDELRRMVYQFKPRTQQDPTFGVFDCPDATQPAPRRMASTTALQALNLLNDPFVHRQAAAFAERVRRDAGSEPSKQASRAFQLAFGRELAAEERTAAAELIETHGLERLCHALFNANEFVIVD